MSVLVIAASKHGSTFGIARAIAEELQANSVLAEQKMIGDQIDLSNVDAVVLGSAVYMGKWMPEAKAFIESNQRILVTRPIWLFSSGPLGDPPKGTIDEHQIQQLMRITAAREHRIFTGNLDPTEMGFTEKLMVKIVQGSTGDFRNWDEIQMWTREIAATLRKEALQSAWVKSDSTIPPSSHSGI